MESKNILITGATDGLGLETAKRLASEGHQILLHGRSEAKLEAAFREVGKGSAYLADFADLKEVTKLADTLSADHESIDVVLNNAGVFKVADPITTSGLDLRFVVNLLAPHVLTTALLPKIPADGRIINLSSAAQASVDLRALRGEVPLDDMGAYAQSKLGLTMWSRALAGELETGPMVVAVNPGSLLASKMVKEGFGVPGKDLGIGVDILCRAALSPEFADVSGQYFDNDAGSFAPPHADALDDRLNRELMQCVRELVPGM